MARFFIKGAVLLEKVVTEKKKWKKRMVKIASQPPEWRPTATPNKD